MSTQSSDVIVRKCYKCEHSNTGQMFCGACGSPLVLNEFITSRVNERLADAVRDRDVLEMDSSAKVFEKALGWLKTLFWVTTIPVAIVGAVIGYRAWDFSKGIESAKQSVTDAAKKSGEDISAATAQSKQDVLQIHDAAKSDIKAASDNAIKQSQSMQAQAIRSKAEIAKNTTSFRADLDASRQAKLARTNADVEAQKQLLSNSQEFLRSIFGTHRSDIFLGLPKHQGVPPGRYVILPPVNGQGNTAVLLLLTATPIPNTIQLQYHVFAQQPNTFFVIAHNLVIFFWGETPANLEGKQISVSYFADLSDRETIQLLSEHDGRWFADDQPLPKFGQPDPDWKGNKWSPPSPTVPPPAKP